MDNIVVDVTLNENDIFEFQKAHYARMVKPGIRIAMIVIIAMLFLVNVIVDLVTGAIISLTAVLLGLILLVILGTPVMFRMSARKSLKTNKMLLATQKYTFTAESISSVSEFNQMNVRWDALHDFQESSEHFLFYSGNNQAFLIPKRAFSEDEAKLQFIRECAKVIPKPKKQFNLFKLAIGISLGLAVIMFIILMIVSL